jgi:hypothetical protein
MCIENNNVTKIVVDLNSFSLVIPTDKLQDEQYIKDRVTQELLKMLPSGWNALEYWEEL